MGPWLASEKEWGMEPARGRRSGVCLGWESDRELGRLSAKATEDGLVPGLAWEKAEASALGREREWGNAWDHCSGLATGIPSAHP